jgi:DNA-directed RNA polymerase specialized sigma24 family protein
MVLEQIMAAISAVPDEMQKTVLTLRYVEGRSWEDIQDMIGYERTQTLVIHGRALWAVKKWMEGEKCGNVDTRKKAGQFTD